MEPFIVGVSGASGAVYGQRLMSVLIQKKLKTHLLLTKSSLKVIKYELNIDLGETTPLSIDNLIRFLGKQSPRYVVTEGLDNWDSPLASGSYRTAAMVIMPCSMATIASIATGRSRNLLERRADVMLKERGRLIVVPRETPLNQIHLRHLLSLSEMGVDIVPAMPAFYHKPQKLEDITDFVVGKVLDLLGLSHTLFRRWRS